MFDNPAGPTVGTRSVDLLERELAAALDSERRADCMARIQTDAVQLALDLAVRETDIDGFFRAFTKTLVEVAFLPVTYRIVAFLKRAENEDYYDRDTDFNPFKLEA